MVRIHSRALMKKLLTHILSWSLAAVGMILLLPTTIGSVCLFLSKRVYCVFLNDHIYNYSLLAFGVKPETLQCTLCGRHPSQKDIDKMNASFASVINDAEKIRQEFMKMVPNPNPEPMPEEGKIVVTAQNSRNN